MVVARRAAPVWSSLFFPLAVALLISGFAALLYQVVWQRLLGLFSGSDVRSVTIVVGAYLAGLGVGSLLGSAIADRLSSRRAVQLFGLCNLGIASFAFLSRFLFYDLLFLRFNTLDSPALVLLISFASLLLPTTLMGLSLPLLSRALVRNMAEAPRQIAWLYAVNTFGSALGALVAGWYLMGTLGYERAVYLGGGLSLIEALIAFSIAGRFAAADQETPTAPRVRFRLKDLPLAVWGWCGLVCLSGFIAISLELIWFRVINVLVESNAYTFAHLLAFVLVGYAVGGWLGTLLLPRMRDPRRAFLTIQGLVALYAVGTVLLIYWNHDTVAQWLTRGRIEGGGLEGALRSYFNTYVLLPTLLLLPPNILIGMAFPVVQRAVQTTPGAVGQRVGLLAVCNIIGNTLGSILTGLVMFDALGTAGSLRVIALLGGLFLLLLLALSFRDSRPSTRVGWVGGGVLLALMAALALFPSTHSLWARLHSGSSERSVVAEDSSGVTVIQQGAAGRVFANGALQGTVPYLAVHGFLGVLPALVHPNPQQALVIGVGSGGTPFAVGVSPTLQRITAVEIIGSELPALEAFSTLELGAPLQPLFNDPRYNIVVGDGRRKLAITTERYDIIQADAIQPWRSHSGLLYSREFFQQARERLAPGGMMAQWLPTRRTEASFMQVFPYGVNIGGAFLLGSEQPIPFDKGLLLERMNTPAVRAYLAKGGLKADELRDMLWNYEISTWTPDTPRADDYNTDLWPRDEYYLNNRR
ncbi:MAG: fused MFS/spermidine synthase [Chloroflexaceae bacterium]|nr:fused MFS/spermidine synthase [Chloroflexaceae bacterium]